ncbi:MAG: MFS transporter [Gemmataceae bacterium]|nr:MFS transporter [Gemmataceae bacterium]
MTNAERRDDPGLAKTRPTNVRYMVVAVSAFAAMWMYIDRVCFSTLSPAIGHDLGIDPANMSKVLGAFFFTYALFQVPVGLLADRFGPRIVLTICIIAWSICTAATSLATGAIGLLMVRLCLGITEAGAYPAAAGLVRRWSSPTERGLLSSIVSFGGRAGGALAPMLTVFAAVTLLGNSATGEQNWRGVFLLYGALGLVAAVLFWFISRDNPSRHPWANEAEAARVPQAEASPQKKSFGGQLNAFLMGVMSFISSRNMWLFGAMQFFVNVSWVFLITSLPSYLVDRFAVDKAEVGKMQTVALTIGLLGMGSGGFFADAMFRWLGPRWGRSVPVAIVMILCAGTYALATQLPSAWGVIIALGLMAFLVDLGIPTIWAFAQDVGGKNVGAALGWGNMIGNFGAAVSPYMLQKIREEFGWDVAFFLCSGSFVLAGFCGLCLNATIPVVQVKTDTRAEDNREV